MDGADQTSALQQSVRRAAENGTALEIRGGRSKHFYGREPAGDPLEISGHRGILSYQPTELVVRVRGGTPLSELEALLAEQGQMLPFEPPHFGGEATIGGAVASGLAGPRRPWGGAPRDLLLGVRILDGRGQILEFGGQVMKNVAGYDLSRMMAGAMGTLGVLLDVSVKVLPRSAGETTLALTVDAEEALKLMTVLQGKPISLSGLSWVDGRLYVRAEAASIGRVRSVIGPSATEAAADFWRSLRDHELPFFRGSGDLWRVSLPPATPPLGTGGELIDWGGALRWIRGAGSETEVRVAASSSKGHATLFRRGSADQVFQPLPPYLAGLHRRLKAVFDPVGILNPGRLFADL